MAELVIKLVNGELAGKTAQSIGKEINAAALAAKKAEVGTKAWIDAHKRLADAKKLQEDLKEQIESTTAASDMLKEAWSKMPFSDTINKAIQGFSLAKKGVGGLISEMGLLKTAIIGTGIGALVVIIGALVTWFTKTEEGADKLKQVLYPLNVIFQKLVGVLADLGGRIFKQLEKAIQDPIQALKDLGDAIIENIINRGKALFVFGDAIKKLFKGDISGAMKSFADAGIQAVTGITNGTDKLAAGFKEVSAAMSESIAIGQQLLDLENAIEDAEVDLTIARAKYNVEFAKQMEIARTVTNTELERLAAAKKVMEITDKMTVQEENFLQLKLKRLILEQSLDNIITDDERLERAKLEAEIIQLQADNIDKKRKASALYHQIEKELEEQRLALFKKNLAEQQKAWEEYYANLRSLEDLHLEAMSDSRAKDLADLELNLRRQLEALDSNASFYVERVAAITELARKARKEINDKWDKKDLDDRLKAQKDSFAKENLELLQKYANREITTSQFHSRILDARKKNLDAQLKLLVEAGQKETEAYRQAAAERAQIDRDEYDDRVARRMDYVSTSVSLAQGLADALIQSRIDANNREIAALESRLDAIREMNGEESAEYKSLSAVIEAKKRDNFERNKKLQIKQVDINLAAELSQIALEAIKLGWPLGLVVGGVLAAGAFIKAENNKANIRAQQYELGGLVEGPSHRAGGVKGIVKSTGQPIEFEGGEFFFSKKATAALGVHNLQRLNKRFTKFESGGPVNPFQNRPAVPRSVGTTTVAADSSTNAIVDRLQSIEESLAKWPTRIKVVNVVSETNDGIKTLNQIQSDADI